MMFIQTVNRTDRLYPLAYAVKSKFLVRWFKTWHVTFSFNSLSYFSWYTISKVLLASCCLIDNHNIIRTIHLYVKPWQTFSGKWRPDQSLKFIFFVKVFFIWDSYCKKVSKKSNLFKKYLDNEVFEWKYFGQKMSKKIFLA